MEQNNNKEKIYKDSVEWANELSKELGFDVKTVDPVLLSLLLHKLVEERENTNRIMKNMLARLDAIESKLGKDKLEGEALVPEIDEKIINFIRENGKATAEDVQLAFDYKGKNGASARLNKLYEQGLLEKKQVGRRVYFFDR